MEMDSFSIKALPSHIEAEKIILGLLLLNNNLFSTISAIINADDFYLDKHKKIFRAISDLISKSTSADLITLKDELIARNQLDEAGGISYVASLADGLPGMDNVEDYALIIKEKSRLRKLIEIGLWLANTTQMQQNSSDEIIAELDEKLFQIKQYSRAPGFESIKEISKNIWDKIEKIYERGDLLTGLPTGFTDLDALTSGLQNGELIIVAGRPSMGKTTFCLNIAQHLAIKHKCSIGIYSLETPKELLVIRMLCSEARIDSSKFKKGLLTQEDWNKLALALCTLADTKIFINDYASVSPKEMKVQASRLKTEYGLDLLIIDYIQLIRTKGKFENRQQEITYISQSLKEIAKDLDIPVIALSQLHRGPEARQKDHRPILADLRESGSLEQDADVVIFLYREDYYNKFAKNKGTAEVIVAKQRNGPTGTIELTFFQEFTRFENQYKEPRSSRFDE
jgi:replicative DNA helicase